MTELDLLAENALIDAQDAAMELTREFVDSDIIQYKQYGIDLALAANQFVRQYSRTKHNNFIVSLQSRLDAGLPLTQPQCRAALNIMRHEMELEGKLVTVKYHDNVVPFQTETECFQCKRKFPSWETLQEHKAVLHGGKRRGPVIAETGEAQRVIEVQTATIGLDLRNLPDGRYAAPDPSGKNDNIFLMVKRVRRTVNRDRRYVYGKIVTGNEIVVAGTIEVKIWSSDSKELIGEQKPGEVYRGKFEEQLQLIMLMPEIWAKLFGKIIGKCCVCGKTLTDDISRQIGMGLECEKKKAYFTTPPKYSFVGDDRPDKWRRNPYDDQYLSGALKYFKSFKPTPPAGSTDDDEDDEDE